MRQCEALSLLLAVVLAGCATGEVRPESEGRVTIEEPISLDSRDLDPEYKDYLVRVRQMIKDKWKYPCVKVKHWLRGERCDYKATELAIDFGVLEDGRVAYVIVRKPSEFAIYNEYAITAVKAAAPYPPIPDSLLGRRKGLSLRVAFKYVLAQSRP